MPSAPRTHSLRVAYPRVPIRAAFDTFPCELGALPQHHLFFFFNDTATTEIYTLSLHDALPISCIRKASAAARIASSGSVSRSTSASDKSRIASARPRAGPAPACRPRLAQARQSEHDQPADDRSEEHTSELQSPDHLVCRLLLEK